MRCKHLHVQQAPGLPRGLPDVKLADGLVVVSGPNASGKSTLARAMRAVLWDSEANTGLRVQSSWDVGDQTCDAGVYAGRVHWDPTPATSPPPAAARLARLGIRSLLSESEEGDAELGKRVLQALSGGLDLKQATESLSRPKQLSARSNLAQDLKTARADKTKATQAADDLSRRERRLDDLTVEIEAARAAEQRLRVWDALRARVDAAEQLAQARTVVEAFEPGLDRVADEDQQRLDTIERELADARSILDNLQSRMDACVAERDRQAFPGPGPSPGDIETQRKRLEAAAEVERSLTELTRALEGANAQLSRAREDVLSRPDDAPDDAPTPSDLDALAEALEAVRDSKATATAKATITQTWAVDVDEVREGDEEPLRRAVDDLRTWLRQPDATESSDAPTGTGITTSILMVIASMLTLAVAVNILTPAWLAAAAWGAFAVSLWALVLALLRRRPDDAASADATRVDRRQQVESGPRDEALSPDRWDHDAVAACLEKLERQFIALRIKLEARRRHLDAEQEQKVAEERLGTANDELQTKAEALGLDFDFVELAAVRQAQALARLGQASADYTRVEVEHRRATKQVADCIDAFAAWIRPFGVDIRPPDVAAARSQLRDLDERRRAHETAIKDLRAADEQRADFEARIANEEERLAAFWKRVGVDEGDRAGLQRRVESLPQWRSAQNDLLEKEGAFRARDEAFEKARSETPNDDHVVAVDPDAVTSTDVDAWREAAAAESDGLEDLRSERSKIQAALESASKGASLADAIAKVRAAERAIADERALSLEDVMARTLLEEARTRHESSHAPPVLNRARDLLSRFTQDGWLLEVDSDGDFRAVDTTCDESRSLAELSDGTRTQLLLAARLAALEELEGGAEPLPLCLDEALANSDPHRFRAVAQALLELVDKGRQVIYLTADPGEAEQWRIVCRTLGRKEPARVDLVDADVDVPHWGDAVPAVPEAPQPVPAPDAKTPADYAVLVRAETPSGFEPVASWHLYVVAFDDLFALHSCLERCLTRVGPWREMRRRGAAVSGVPEPVATRFDDRIALADALQAAWRIGRGRPVTWSDVEDSGAVSTTYEDQVRDVLEQHAYTPRRFIAEVGDLKSFRNTKLDELRTHLEEVGCLAVDEPLSCDQLVARAMHSAQEAVDRLGSADARAYLDWLLALLDADA